MFQYAKTDAVAGLVVFFVAIPLCLGIAVACGVPPVSGLVAGIVGGLVVPFISRAPLSVTGPAAGLTSTVLLEVARLGGVPPFLTAVILAGFLQQTFGFMAAGRLASMVPSAVIKGMLAAIGVTIVWKQLAVAAGGSGTVLDAVASPQPGALLIAATSLALLYGWKHTPLSRLALLPPALVVVVFGGLAAWALGRTSLALHPEHFVAIPVGGVGSLVHALPRPDWGAFARTDVWIAALTLAVVASLESLLSIQAVDRLDPLQRHSPPDRELMAQGVANVIAGLLGGLPVTAVIIRSGANIAAGGLERFSAVVHGALLLLAVLLAGPLLNGIPLACLAALLIQVGLHLCRPALFIIQYRLGMTQLLPFAVTILAVLAFDLLKGVVVGIIAGIAFVLYENSRRTIHVDRDDAGAVRIRFRRDGTFVVKPSIVAALERISPGETVVIDAADEYIDHDVKDLLATFQADARRRRITVRFVGIDIGQTRPEGH